jgi:hypothetical protein
MLMKRVLTLLLAPLLGACAIPNAIESLGDRSPPPEFGRPTWVRVCAGIGGWVGGVAGGVVSLVVLPVTYPLSLLVGDSFTEHASDEFLLFPALGGAAIGHCLLGTPPDIIDWVFRRAWVAAPDPVTSYDFIPMEGPMVPRAPTAPDSQ